MRMTVAGASVADTHGMSSWLSPLIWRKQRVFCVLFFCICKCPSASQWQLKLRSFSSWEYQPMLRYSSHTGALTSSHNRMDYLSPCFFFRLSSFSCHSWVSRASLLFMSRQKKFSINLIEMKFQNLLRGNLTRRDIKAGLPGTGQAWQKIRIPVRRNPLQASSQWCSHSMKWLILCHSGTGDHPNGQIAADWNASDVWMFYLCWRHQPWRTL